MTALQPPAPTDHSITTPDPDVPGDNTFAPDSALAAHLLQAFFSFQLDQAWSSPSITLAFSCYMSLPT
ncbi:unnamed protein product [Ectocarpus sp. CCAP 1310/34]|nr:unnamed protein product [Ectocarpus sp. CCAP 1310/34]